MTDSTNIYTSPSTLTSQQKERNKISYWLEKLFDQEQNKNKKILDNINKIQSSPIEVKQNTNTNQVRKIEDDRLTVANMVHNSNTILMSVTSVFPFDYFPTTINVEATRVTIIHRQLFASQVHSVDIKDISSVFIETSIIFATITLISKTYEQKKLMIKRLWKKEAILLRRIIEGLRMFEENNVNTTKYSKKELLSKCKELSETKIVL